MRLAWFKGEKEMTQITGNAIIVRTLFNNRYTVQYYQREYNWERKQIEELMEDLTGEFLEFYQQGDTQRDVIRYGSYFLGPIILTNDNAIIDGQQRLSSLTLLLIFLNNLQKNSTYPKVNIDNLIYSEMYGQKTFCINVEERESCLAGFLIMEHTILLTKHRRALLIYIIGIKILKNFFQLKLRERYCQSSLNG